MAPRLVISAAAALAVAVAVVWASLAGIGSLIGAVLTALGAVWTITGPGQFLGLLAWTLIAALGVALGIVACVAEAAETVEARMVARLKKPGFVQSPTSEVKGLVPEVGEGAIKFSIFGAMALLGTIAWLFLLALATQKPLSGGLAPEAVWLIDFMPLVGPSALAVAGVVLAGFLSPGPKAQTPRGEASGDGESVSRISRPPDSQKRS